MSVQFVDLVMCDSYVQIHFGLKINLLGMVAQTFNPRRQKQVVLLSEASLVYSSRTARAKKPYLKNLESTR